MLSAAVALALIVGPLTGTAAAAPTPTAPPTLSTTNAYVTETLTVTQGMYTGATNGVSDAWDRCSGVTCTPTGTTGSSYTVVYADVGDTLKVVETATASDNTTVEQDTSQTGIVPAPPTNATPPVIASSPPPGVGNTLTATQGTWPTADAGSITDTWEDCNGSNCTAIPGATTTTATTSYTLTPSDIGHTIEVMETATRGGTPANPPVFSQPTAVVTYVPTDVNVPTISGTALLGQTLTASPGTWADNPTSYTYQWEDCDSGGQGCTAISGATGQTYAPGENDLGHTIVVSVAGVNAGGTGAAATSAATGVVKTTSSVSFGAAPISPVTNQGVTLVATVTSQAAAGEPSGTVVFLDNGKPISGCLAAATGTAQTVTVICQTTFPAESAQLTAAFTPAAGSVVLGSTSPVTTLPIRQDAATVSLDASPLVQVNASTTYTATVAPKTVPAGPFLPSGSVQFLDGGKPIAACAAQPVSAGGATCTIKYGSTGSHSISARYLGDSNFTGSSSATEAVRITPLSAKGTVTSTMQWTFLYAPAYTRVLQMVINGVPTGAKVQILCHGRGCPFAKRSRTMAKPKPCSAKAKRKHECPVAGRISLTATFHSRQLRPKTQITVEIRRPEFVGKYYSFTMRSRNQPKVRIACLAVNGTRPGVGC